MPLFEDSLEKEIERLRQIVAKLDAAKGVRVVTVEWARKPGFGYLFYITAPTSANEKEFGLALAETMERSFKTIGLPGVRHGFAREINEPPSEREIAIEQLLARPPVALAVRPSIAECYMTEGAMGRWIIANVEDPELAWSGSRWVGHNRGVPIGGVQISNFATQQAAALGAMDAGLVFFLDGFMADDKSITCFRCGRTSYNENDVRERYCGNCHVFHVSGQIRSESAP